ncbi:MAG: peptidase M23 [Ruminococcaceae bacterium]|nr:peptidase M23 [Oscillospiraceae bacterium]
MGKRNGCTALLGRILSVLLALAMLMPLPMVISPDVMAVTQAEIDSLKADAGDLDRQKAELQKQLKAIAADKNKAMDQKELLEQQVDVIQSEIGNINQQIGKYDELIAQAQSGIAETEQEEAKLYELFCQRVRYMEEEGDVNYWAILFNAASFSDLLDRLIMVDEIMEYDNAVMDSLATTRRQLQEDKTQLEQARVEQQTAKDKQVAARKELESREAEVDKLIAQINKEKKQVEHSVKELEALAKKMDEEIARKQRELAAQLEAQGKKITSESGYKWPLPDYTNLSSLFAGRKDPFTGKPATHSGIDVPAPKGVKILSAKSGVVLTSAYNKGGYGNYVVVDHGNGNTTLYAHMNSRAVKAGDVVKQGQVLGYVGTTGRSTGNHLHYEIREKNVRIDPVTRYSGLTYKGKKL